MRSVYGFDHKHLSALQYTVRNLKYKCFPYVTNILYTMRIQVSKEENYVSKLSTK